MSSQAQPTPMLVIPKETGGSRGKWLVLFAVVVAVAGYAAWRSGMRPNNMWASTPDAAMTTVTVDEGEMFPFAIENGTLENSSNTTVRCEVEALLGQVGGAQGGAGGMGAGGAGGGRGGAGGGGLPATQLLCSPRRPRHWRCSLL